MILTDFKYDGIALSDMGYMLSSFDSGGSLETVQNGVELTMNTVPVLYGNNNLLTSAVYEDTLTTTLQICRDMCDGTQEIEISTNEFRELSEWLCRKRFLPLIFEIEDFDDLYFEATFNISRIEVDGVICGLELNVVTNKPFALLEERVFETYVSEGEEYEIENESDEEGHIYLDATIVLDDSVSDDSELIITNSLMDESEESIYSERETVISECSGGETITMNYPVISTDYSSHNIMNDFNWNFLRLESTYEAKTNVLSFNLPCTITLKYSPIVKIGL